MNLRYRVELSQAERDELKALLSAGKHPARKLKRAQILLAADAGATDEDIAISVGAVARPCIEPSAALCLVTLRRHSAKSRVQGLVVSCRAKKKPCWWRPPVRGRPPHVPQMDLHHRQGTHKNGARLSLPNRYPGP
jgi:hypothetical protein